MLAVLTLLLAAAEVKQPPLYFYDDIPSSATSVDFDFARSCRIGTQIFVLEKDRLADVIKRLGCGEMSSNNEDAAGGEFFVDFVQGTNLIRFSSNNEMGGPDCEIDGIEVRPANASELRNCPRLGMPITFLFGGVGMTVQQLRSKLGPQQVSEQKIYYVHEEALKLRISGQLTDYDLSDALIAEVRGNRVIAIKMLRCTST